jgi:biopolymer transport protein ExbD
MDAQLPDTAAPGTGSAIVLEVGPGGRYALNRVPVPAAGLAAQLRTIYAGRRDKTLIVKGDRAAKYQEVITAMDLARGAGVAVLAVDPRR